MATYQPATPLPGCNARPAWPTPQHVPPANSPAPPLTLTVQVLDTPDAQREAARMAGQLDLDCTERTD